MVKKYLRAIAPAGIITLTFFSLFVFLMVLRNSLRDFYLGPQGDEGQFIHTVVKVSLGTDLWQELIKIEHDYRLIVMKLVWAGNYLFTQSSLFSSAIVILFLAIYTSVVGWMLYKDVLLSRMSKWTIFSAFMLANFGGFAESSLSIPVFGTWPIVYSCLFTGSFFLLCAVNTSAVTPLKTSASFLNVIANLRSRRGNPEAISGLPRPLRGLAMTLRKAAFLFLAHLFGFLALATFGHAFLYFIFYAITLWVYRVDVKRIILYCLPGLVLTILYLTNYHSGQDAIRRLSDHHDVLFNLAAYYCRALAGALYYFTTNFTFIATVGCIGLVFLLPQLWNLLSRRDDSPPGNPLYAIFAGIGCFAGVGLMLGVFGRYDEMQAAYPQIPGRMDVQVDTLWACVCGISLLRSAYLAKYFKTPKKFAKINVAILLILSPFFLVIRQLEFGVLIPSNHYFSNNLYVAQALGLHNGYLSRVGDTAQWLQFNNGEPDMRRLGVSGFAIKERYLVGLSVGADLPVLPAEQCQLSDSYEPGISTYDHLTDPGIYIDGQFKQSAGATQLSSVILVANQNNKIIGFGYRSTQIRDRWARPLSAYNYYAIAPWKNEGYSTYVLNQSRTGVCLLNQQLPVPARDTTKLARAIAPLHYTGKSNQLLLFPDRHMHNMPFFDAFIYEHGKLSHYEDEHIPFDTRIISNVEAPTSTDTGAVAIVIPPEWVDRMKGHQIKIKLLVKRPPEDAAATSTFRILLGNKKIDYSFSASKNWEVVEKTFSNPIHYQSRQYIWLWGDTSGKNKGLLFRAGMIEILE